MRVAVLSPHRDDAAFSCGLLLSRLVPTKASVTIVNVFTISSYAPHLTQDCSDPVLQVTSARRKEDEAFTGLLTKPHDSRAVELLDLAWRDLPLRWSAEDEQALAPHALPVAEIEALCKTFAALPRHDLVLAPLALGGHVDHRLVREAAQQAFEPASLVFYEDLPYACRMTVAERQAAMLAHEMPSSEAWLPQDVTSAGLKRSYALCYPSQIAPDVADEMERYAEDNGWREHFLGDPEAMGKLHTMLHSQGARG